MNESMRKLIELQAKQLRAEDKLEDAIEEVKRAETDEQLDAATNTAEDVKAELEAIKQDIAALEQKIAETDKAEEQKAEEEEAEQEAIKNENEDLIEEERKKMANTELRAVRVETAEERAAKTKQIEERAKALREGRSVLIASDEILVPTHQAKNIVDTPYKQYSDIVDMVDVENLDGGETHEFAFVKSYGTAGLTGEGEEYEESDPVTDYDTISKAKMTVYTEISEEALKLPAINYENVVKKNLDVAIKKKLAQQITAGAGTTNTFKGILSGTAKALESTDIVTVSAIDRLTLKKVIYKLGGDEEIFGPGVVFLNKLTLQEFDELYNADRGDFEYKVDYDKQTINGIPYCINNSLPAFSTATAGQTFMIYGMPKAYGVKIFSPVEVMKSTDFKFRTGMVAYKASFFAGGNVVGYRGFVLAKKGE